MKAISHVEQEVNKIRLQIYEETKRRPKYIVEKALGFSKEEGEA